MIYIYGLKCPILNEIKYVGKAINPKKRLIVHISRSKKETSRKALWLNELSNINLKPEIIILEEIKSNEWQEKEKYWIKYYKDKGNKLTNMTIGGDGTENSPAIYLSKRLQAIYNRGLKTLLFLYCSHK